MASFFSESAEPARSARDDSSGSSAPSVPRRTDTLVREGIVPTKTSGLLNEVPPSPSSSSMYERRSRIVSSSSSKQPRSGPMSLAQLTRSRSVNESSAMNTSSIIPFPFTKSLGSSWYQVSGVDSGNVTLRGGNHSGNGHLSLSAGSQSNFMLVHYNLHTINQNLTAYDLRFVARWEGLDEQLHLIMFYHCATDYCVLSVRPRQGLTILRQCHSSPSEDPAALANGQILAEFEYDPMVFSHSDMVIVSLRLTTSSMVCTMTVAPPSSPASTTSTSSSSSTPPSTPEMIVFEWISGTGDDPGNEENPYNVSPQQEMQLDLSQGCVSGVLVTSASRLLLREWTVRPRYPTVKTLPSHLQQVPHMPPPATPTTSTGAPPLTPTRLRPLPSSSTSSTPLTASSKNALRSAGMTTPKGNVSSRNNNNNNNSYNNNNINNNNINSNNYNNINNNNNSNISGPQSTTVTLGERHQVLAQLLPGLSTERLVRLSSLPFEKEILNAILADLLLPASSPETASSSHNNNNNNNNNTNINNKNTKNNNTNHNINNNSNNSNNSNNNSNNNQGTNTFQRVSFDDIAGLDNAKHLLSEAIILPTLLPSFFTGHALRIPWRGILLFGPPGTGKTLLARAVASLQASVSRQCPTGSNSNSSAFFNCSSASLVSKWRGDSEKLVKCLFAVARCVAPSVIFLDEVDALVATRGTAGEHEASRRMKTEFFAQMDGIATQQDTVRDTSEDNNNNNNRIVVLATTNCPWDLDPAVLRRFEKRIYVPLPDKAARHAHFALCLKQMMPPSSSAARDTVNVQDTANAQDTVHVQDTVSQQQQQQQEEEDIERHAWIEYFATHSEGLSSADIVSVCREASMAPIRRLLASHSLDTIASMAKRLPTTAYEDVLEALRRTRPSVPQTSIARYEAWNELYGTTPADAYT